MRWDPLRTVLPTRPWLRSASPGPVPTRRELNELLIRLQRELFVVGAELATAPENTDRAARGVIFVTPEMVARLGDHRRHAGRFEPPREFVLPGQNSVAAALDFARTVIRRAERVTVAATRVGWLGAESQVVPYLNRLADLVYTLSRWQEGDFRPK